MKKILYKLLALMVMLMAVPLSGWAQEVSSHSHYFVNSVCKSCGFQKKLASTNVGAVGILDGREAIVVELNVNGVTKKVAVATENIADNGGKGFSYADALDATKTGLTDGWYVPTKDEMEALAAKLTFNSTRKGAELVMDDKTLFLPAEGYYYGGKWNDVNSSCVYWTCTSPSSGRGYRLDMSSSVTRVLEGNTGTGVQTPIRPFHELGEISGIQLTPTGTNVEGFSGESYYKAFDGITTNKWCGQKTDDAPYVEFQSSTPTTIESYYIYTGNDINASDIEGVRNPMSWALFAKTNPTDNWTKISSVDDGELPTTCSTKKVFMIDPVFRNYSFQYFQLVIYYTTIKKSEYIFEIGEIGIEAEHIHDFPAGKVICDGCGYMKPHDHVYVNYVCTKCGEEKKFASSTAGEVGMLDGREAIVVDLNINGVTKKVAVATINIDAANVQNSGEFYQYEQACNPNNLGLADSRWYVPTKEELEALANQLTWNSTKIGREINFPSKGTSLFIPAAGWSTSLKNYYDNGEGYIWSTTSGTNNQAYCLKFNNSSIQVVQNSIYNYYNVRPFHLVEISGNTNSSVRWKLNFLTNTLTFEGTGNTTPSTSVSNTYNLEDYKDCINTVVFGEGITQISGDCVWEIDMEKVIFPSTLKTIDNYSFKNCTKLKEVTLPASLREIYKNSFYNCTNLTKLIYGEGTTEPLRAYLNVNTVVLPNSVTKIGSRVFWGCSKLQNINIPNSVTEIGSYAFRGCSNLPNINIPNSVTVIGDYAFYECSKLHEVILPGSLTAISSYTFHSCTNLQVVTLPNTLEEIGYAAFIGCENLVSIDLPANLKSIGGWAFRNCKKLQNVIIPSGVTVINNSFDGCEALQSITIPSTVTSVSTYAFNNTSNLKSVIIEGCPYLNDNAFNNCPALQVVELKGQETFNSSATAFANYPSSCVLRISSTLYEWATATAPWSEFIIETRENLLIVNADDTKSYEYLDPNASDNVWELVDGLKSLRILKDINMSSLTYKRNFSSATWQSLFVPFDIEVTEDVLSMCDIAIPYMVSTKGSTNGGTQEGEKGLDALVLMKLESGETAHAGTPYFIRPKNTGAFELTAANTILHNTNEKHTLECATVFDEYQFIGQYAQGKPEAGTTWYAITSSGSLVLVGDDSLGLGAMRSYMTKTSKNPGAAPAQARAMRIVTLGEDNEATAIVAAHADATDSSKAIYSISGVRLNKPQKGLNIIGGKKVVIK